MSDFPINPVDGIVILAIVLSGLLALIRGLVREVLSLISWFIAIYVGAQMAPVLKPMMLKYIENPILASSAGGFIVFLVTLIILTIFSSIVANSIRNSSLSAIDRSLGFLFGAARGFLVVSLIYLCGTLIFTNDKEYPKWLTEARTQPALAATAAKLQGLMPKDLKDDFDSGLKGAKDNAKQAKDAKENLDRLSHKPPESADKPPVAKAAEEAVPAKKP